MAAALLMLMMVGAIQMPDPNKPIPEIVDIPTKDWQALAGKEGPIEKTYEFGMRRYRHVYDTDSFNQQERDCVKSQVWYGWAQVVNATAKITSPPLPPYILAEYDLYESYFRKLMNDKCGGGGGGRGQRMCTQWLSDIQAEWKGRETRVEPKISPQFTLTAADMGAWRERYLRTAGAPNISTIVKDLEKAGVFDTMLCAPGMCVVGPTPPPTLKQCLIGLAVLFTLIDPLPDEAVVWPAILKLAIP